MQTQHDNSSEEVLSMYRKRGYEYVEEEKTVLDELVTLYRKRLEVIRNYQGDLEELHSTVKSNINPASSLYKLLVSPVLGCLQRDIEAYGQYEKNLETELDKITTLIGPRGVVQEIKRDTEAVEPIYSEYLNSCATVLALPTPSVSLEQWRTHEEDIKHRQLSAKLHLKQKTAKLHFEDTYPKLLDDHMSYLEDVKKLVQNDSTYRSELSTQTACNAGEEKNTVHRFSKTDIIAVPYMEMDLERDRQEYRHAPILNPLTRKLEEDRTVIFGRDIDMESDDDIVQEVLIACLDRYPTVVISYDWLAWKDYWFVIRHIEIDSRVETICDTISKLQSRHVIGNLISVLMKNTMMGHLLLNAVDPRPLERLAENHGDRSALASTMKGVNPNIRRILKACAAASIQTNDFSVAESILGMNYAPPPVKGRKWAIEVILRNWDFELWRPLPQDIQWRRRTSNEGDQWICRKKRFRVKPEYIGLAGEWVWLEVDENGDVIDTPENERRKGRIQVTSRINKVLQKLKI